MAQRKGRTSLAGVQCQHGGAMNANGLSLLMIPGTAIPVASNQTEGTRATSATTQVRHGIKEGQGSMSGRWPHDGTMDGVIWSSPIQCSRASFTEKMVREDRVAHHESEEGVGGVREGSEGSGRR